MPSYVTRAATNQLAALLWGWFLSSLLYETTAVCTKDSRAIARATLDLPGATSGEEDLQRLLSPEDDFTFSPLWPRRSVRMRDTF